MLFRAPRSGVAILCLCVLWIVAVAVSAIAQAVAAPAAAAIDPLAAVERIGFPAAAFLLMYLLLRGALRDNTNALNALNKDNTAAINSLNETVAMLIGYMQHLSGNGLNHRSDREK